MGLLNLDGKPLVLTKSGSGGGGVLDTKYLFQQP